MCFQKNYCDCLALHWDVIPECSAVSPLCTQMQRNIYVEICEIRHRVAPGSGDANCVCTPVAKQRSRISTTLGQCWLQKRLRGFY